jgi:hypothetical protein
VSLPFASPTKVKTTNTGKPHDKWWLSETNNSHEDLPLGQIRQHGFEIHKETYHPPTTAMDHNITGSAHCQMPSLTPLTRHRLHARRMTPFLTWTPNYSPWGSLTHCLGLTHHPYGLPTATPLVKPTAGYPAWYLQSWTDTKPGR